MQEAPTGTPCEHNNIAALAVPIALCQGALRALTSGGSGTLLTLDELQRQYVVAVLEVCKGNKTEAARVLGIHRRSLYRWLARKAG